HALQQGESFHLSDFGVMRPGPNDTILFEYHARLSVAPEVPVDIIPDLIEKLREEPKRPERVEPKAAEPSASVAVPAIEPTEEEAADEEFEEDEFEFEEVDDRDDSEAYDEQDVEAVVAVSRPSRRVATRQKPAPKKRPDYFMILAIVVAAIALMAIAFGMYSNAQVEPDEEPIERVEIDPAMVEAAGGGEE
ncbi:MAG: hypothetical protein Q4A18_02570, partial [Rikenellaceae bacterium]|nr:hypothetical protein [Rikenellaceae bacterium]